MPRKYTLKQSSPSCELANVAHLNQFPGHWKGSTMGNSDTDQKASYEDASGEHGEAVSTISSSMNPLQPPDASSEEPFTTYFDSKIPIPEDETVSAAGPSSTRSDRKIRSETSASAW